MKTGNVIEYSLGLAWDTFMASDQA